jgi:diguanylate cyclase (GGDEF)-like protein
LSGFLLLRLSIQSRLRLFFALCLLLLVSVSAFGIGAILTLERLANSFDRQWLAGTQTLGEISDLVSEFRIDEDSLADATDPHTASERRATAAKYSAEMRAYEISKRRETYAALPHAADDARFLAVFDSAWQAYLKEHRDWAALPPEERRATLNWVAIRLDQNYEATKRAVGVLIGSNRARATEALARGERIVDASAIVLSTAAGLALLLVGGMIIIVRNNISRPLAAITDAMAELAAGNRDVVVPESSRTDEIGALVKAFDVFRANTFALEEAHKLAEEAHRREQALARHDPLTGLSNRRVLAEELEKGLARATRLSTSFAVLLIDLDRFKPVNDIHGHSAGDAVLVEIASRLRDVVRKNDTLARIGGDEFAVICDLESNSPADTKDVILFAERVIDAVRTPVQVAGIAVDLDASIGIAFGPTDGGDPEAILRAADIAMYRAKRAGRGTFRFYEESMDKELRARAALEADVRQALASGDIAPHYQPLFELHTGTLVGFEVLARWTHFERGSVPPNEFIPVIEHVGLAADFTWSILRRACLDAKAWAGDLQLSINVSPIQLRDLTFPARLLGILHETEFSPRRLEIEITETALMSDLETVKTVITALQNLGVKIALDDFGTGYSSLYHLRELKLDKIKIDRSFVNSIHDNPDSNKIVTAILGLARSLSLPTTAEGIEDSETVTRMQALGCDIGQGYYFGKAMPAQEAAAFAGHEIHGHARKIA